MNEPLVSVIIPVYNAEKYLNFCIESVLKQKYNNFEILLIDDGSTDNSFKICKKYEKIDKRIVLIHKKNEGRCKARNYGISHAKGEYIAFLDDDDFYSENYLCDMMKLIVDYKADISCCKYTKFNDYSTIEKKEKNNKIYVYCDDDILKEYLHNRESDIYCNVWTKIYSKKLFNSIVFENDVFEDLFITYKLMASAKKIVYCNNVYYYYNIGNLHSLTYKFDRLNRIKEREKYIEEVGTFFKNNVNIKNELLFHIMEQKITICNDLYYCDKTKELLNKRKENRLWIVSNIGNPIFDLKTKLKITLIVFFYKQWKILKNKIYSN